MMLIIGTGGTFDKDYHPQQGQLYVAPSCVPTLLQQAHIDISYQFVSLLQKDSLDMTESDRGLIADYCQRADEIHILIVHGTDTLCETASYLAQQEVLKHKTIVLTGAMRPRAFGNSDAEFNLGYAVAITQCQSAGVYIAIQGMCYRAGEVYKDRQQARFIRHTQLA